MVNNTADESNIHSTLGYALVNPPSGAAISANGIITWMPTRAQGPATNLFTTVVTNTNPYDFANPHLAATNSFIATVYAPTLASIGNQTVNPGQNVIFTASAVDNDPTRSLAFSLVGPPAGAVINSSGGAFSWRVPVAYAGSSNNFQVRVSDNSPVPVTDTRAFFVLVNPLAPLIITPLAYSGGQFSLRVSGSAGPDYIIQASTNLTQWSSLETNLSPALPFTFTDLNAGSFGDRFYRVQLVP